MSDIAIRVENLSKLYHIGVAQKRHDTLRDQIADFGLQISNWGNRLFHPTSNVQSPISNSTIWALQDVSFEVKRGEVVGIIGRNGAGKSTLLKILSRITKPTRGWAEIYGRVGSLLEVWTGFQGELTGRENIFLNGAILGMSKREIERKFDEIVAFSEVEKFIDTPVKHYSSGMYVRLAFAVAAHLEPEILIVDEVLAVGDAAFQKKCMGKMGDVAKEGRTVLFVSHNMAAVDALCSRGCLLVNGQIATLGKASEVISKYLDSVRGIAFSNLGDRKDRAGNGNLVITRVGYESDGVHTDTLVSGKDACIVLDYSANRNLRNVSVSIGFYGLYGQFLLMCNNEMAGYSFESLPQNGQIRCSIPRLPFAPGTYNLNLYCEVNGVVADWVQEACQLTVVEGDYYGSGKTSPASHGGFLVSQTWDLIPNGQI